MHNQLQKINNKIKNELPGLRLQYHISHIEIFGSFLKNEQTKNSDIDILVSFSKPPSLFTFVELENILTKLLGIKVDMVMKSALKPNIGKIIQTEARPIQ